MVHYLATGHFEEEDGHIRFVRAAANDPWQRVTSRPLDLALVERALREVAGDGVTLATIPREWGVSLCADGTLVSNEYTHARAAVEFVARVAELTGAQIWADCGQRKLTPREVVHQWAERVERVRRAKSLRIGGA